MKYSSFLCFYVHTYFWCLYDKISCNTLNKNHSIKYYDIFKDKIRHVE